MLTKQIWILWIFLSHCLVIVFEFTVYTDVNYSFI